MTHLQCAHGCGRSTPVFSAEVSCPRCGGLLDPVVDVDKLKERSADDWRRLLDERAASVDPIDRSGVWAHREWVLPEADANDVVTLGEGRSPLLDVGRMFPSWGAWIKQCGQQPTGSFKDLGMTVLVSAARAMMGGKGRGKGTKIELLACASTGDTSAALAAYGARAGIPVVVLLPAGKVSPAQLAQPLAHGATVIELDGNFDDCMAVVQQLGERPGVFLANSKNPIRLLGQMTVAFEIAREMRWHVPDVVVVPSGNLGNVAAMHMGFQLLVELGLTQSMPRLVAAQVAAADPFHRTMSSGASALTPVDVGETLATAIRIGNPVSYPRARRALEATNGTTVSVTEAEVAGGMAALDRVGVLACPQTGAAMAGAMKLGTERWLKAHATLVIVGTASGLKFMEAKTSVETNKPTRVPATIGDVENVLKAIRR